MTIYRILRDRNIEAKSIEQAECNLLENNGSATESYFTDREAAEAAYSTAKSKLDPPKYLGRGLYWFDGIALEVYVNCDPEEENLKEAALVGDCEGADVEVRGF